MVVSVLQLLPWRQLELKVVKMSSQLSWMCLDQQSVMELMDGDKWLSATCLIPAMTVLLVSLLQCTGISSLRGRVDDPTLTLHVHLLHSVYQYGDTDAFYTFQGIETNYISGVSLTHGAEDLRQHIWTFAAGITQNSENHHTTSTCPCDAENQVITPQAFIGDDYMCESSPTSGPHAGDHIFYGDHPLWDGEGCKATSTCCVFNTPPWFTRDLPGPTTDDIEMRLCVSVSATNGEDIPLKLIELYIK